MLYNYKLLTFLVSNIALEKYLNFLFSVLTENMVRMFL